MDACDAFVTQESLSSSITASHPIPSDLIKDPLRFLSNMKLEILLLLLLKKLIQDCQGTDAEAWESPDLTWRTEFTHPEDLSVGTTIYKSSESQPGEIPAASLLGKKMPFKTLFYFWLQWKAGHHPLGISGVQRVQAFNKGKFCTGAALPWRQYQHTQHLFLPLNHFIPFFLLPLLQRLTPSLPTPAYLDPRQLREETNCKASLPIAVRAKSCWGVHGEGGSCRVLRVLPYLDKHLAAGGVVAGAGGCAVH